jgi:hypothetical protein
LLNKKGEIMIETLNSISRGIAGFSGTALNYAGALAIAGTIAMAFLQLLKDLTPIRRWYQNYWLTSWFKERAKMFNSEAKKIHEKAKNIVPVDAAKAQSTLTDLATGGEEKAFYDLEIQQVVAQMNAAAQIALEYPHLHFPLLAILSQGASIDDVYEVLESTGSQTTKQLNQAALDARNRVGHRIQRNLDGIQIACGSRWKYCMQAVSIVLTVLFVEIAIFTTVAQDERSAALFVGLFLGLAGGYLAPVTRDVVAALQNLRKG